MFFSKSLADGYTLGGVPLFAHSLIPDLLSPCILQLPCRLLKPCLSFLPIDLLLVTLTFHISRSALLSRVFPFSKGSSWYIGKDSFHRVFISELARILQNNLSNWSVTGLLPCYRVVYLAKILPDRR